MAKRPCSELAATVTQLAMHVGARPDVKSLADVVTHLEKELPGITREILVNSINEATTGHRAAKDALQKKLADLRREARTDVSLRRAAVAMEQHVKGGTRPAPVAKKASPKEIQEVREKIRGLRQQLATSDPKAREKVKARIAELDALIAKGESPKPRERKAAPADLQALRDERDAKYRQAKTADPAAREAVRAQIRAIEKHLADETFPDKAERPTAPADLQKLRDERDALAAELRRNDPKIRQDIQQQIAELEGHLKAGTLPQPPAAKADNTPADVLALREARDNLQSALAKSEPALREKYQKQIDDLTQRLEDGVELPGPKPEAPKLSAELDRLVYQRDRLKSEIRQRIDDLRPKSVWSRVGEVANTAKSLTTGYDLSGIGRQGFIIGVGNPARAARAIPQALRAMMRPEVSYRIHQEILNRPNAPLYARSKLYIADDPSGTFQLGKQEESFMSAIARKIPGVAASERAYSTYLNLLRADTFDAMHASLTREGVATEAEAKAIANFINVATGRPGLGSLEGAATALNTVFFSPRYFASRVMYITGQPLMRGTMATRKLVAKEYAKTFIGLGAIYTLAALAGARIGTDSTSSDFGKIIVGDQRIDPLAGLSQAAVIMSRIGTGKTTDVAGRTKPTDMYTLGKFVRSKLSPAAGVAVDLALRKDYNNKPVTLLGEAAKLTIPITYQDILEQLKEEGAGKGTAASLLNVFGINAQNFDDHARR